MNVTFQHRFVLIGFLLLGLGCGKADFPTNRVTKDEYYRSHPIGGDYFQRHGEYPQQYDFCLEQASIGGIYLPNPMREADRVELGQGSDGLLGIGFFSYGMRLPTSDIRHVSGARAMSFHRGELIPYYDHVFQVICTKNTGRIVDLTRQISSDLLPSADSRVITLGDRDGEICRLENYDVSKTKVENHRVALRQFDHDGKRAQLELSVVSRWKCDDGRIETSESEPKLQWVRIGDTLELSDRKLRVRQIVPPIEIEGVGKPIGWIELALVEPNQIQS
ncbi:hypothetical protein GC197_12910 [bacterium]|nr:hypothetical protein [bacterium]